MAKGKKRSRKRTTVPRKGITLLKKISKKDSRTHSTGARKK